MKHFSTPRLPHRLLITLGALMLSGQAMAHAHLDGMSPTEDAELSAPERIELTFTEGLELAFSSIELSDESGNTVALGDAALENGDTTLGTSIDEALDPGEYMVVWQVLSVDGHQTEGDYHFTVTP